jgi:hypothetical protein
MAATVAASKSYNLLGAQLGPTKEDLQDMIYDISPMDTVFMNTIERGKATSTVHEWLTDTLVAASANAAVEGDSFSAVARTPPQRLKNYCQISRKDIEVTGTANAVDNAGMAKLMAYFTARAGKELKRDMEVGFLQNVAATSGGASLSARVSAGAENWIYIPNHLSPAGSSGTGTTVAPASGFATGAVTDSSATAVVEADLKSLLQQAWSTGGETDVILSGPTIYNKISQFSGIATRFRNVESRAQAQIIGAADVYVSAFGTHKIMLSRYCRSTVLFAFDMSTWAVNYLRPFQVVDIAKIGDAERKMLLAEYTLVCRSPSANTKMTGING